VRATASLVRPSPPQVRQGPEQGAAGEQLGAAAIRPASALKPWVPLGLAETLRALGLSTDARAWLSCRTTHGTQAVVGAWLTDSHKGRGALAQHSR